MDVKQESLRSQIALGWTLMLLDVLAMLIDMIVQSSFMNDGLHALLRDPGRRGLTLLTWLIAIYALMPVYVSLVHAFRWRALRWLAVAIAGAALLYLFLHHTSHWVHGDRPDASSHVLDVVHHLLGLWVILNSVRWAKLDAAAG